ncbi:hypothetical protein [Novosphingobium sp. 9]|uniref:hypothetical protein n=1 Tax=Novosphingobium sp. 9 TaxID=2025349 RepID=UPI0021B66BF4|nr:hypothetical protein [Novosphingobium sp. 9]
MMDCGDGRVSNDLSGDGKFVIFKLLDKILASQNRRNLFKSQDDEMSGPAKEAGCPGAFCMADKLGLIAGKVENLRYQAQPWAALYRTG